MKQLGLLIVTTTLSLSAFGQEMTVLNCQCAVVLPTADANMPVFGDQSVFTNDATQSSTNIVIKQVVGVPAKPGDEQYMDLCAQGNPDNYRNTCWQHMMNAKTLCENEAITEYNARGITMDPLVVKNYSWVQEEGCSLGKLRNGVVRD